jgi:hypothetical protein
VHEATFRRGVARLQASDHAGAAIAPAINEKIIHATAVFKVMRAEVGVEIEMGVEMK